MKTDWKYWLGGMLLGYYENMSLAAIPSSNMQAHAHSNATLRHTNIISQSACLGA